MARIIKSAFLLLSQLLFLTSVLATPTPVTLESRECGTVIAPSQAWGIRKDSPDYSGQFGPNPPDQYLDFQVSQGDNANFENDLIVAFRNVPCPPAGQGPYSIEFLFQPGSDTYYTYSGKRIDMFSITGPLPANPTWNNLESLRGSLIGSFSLPIPGTPEASQEKRVFINQLVCQPEIDLRFSITNDSPEAGSVNYYQRSGRGLQLRYGC